MYKKIILAICITVFAFSGSLGLVNCYAESGRNIYVDVNKGNDSNDGSQNSPFQTLQKACDIVAAGDVVTVMPGIYYGNVKLTRSGTKEKPIIFRAYDNKLHSVTLSGAVQSIREGKQKWILEDATLGIYSVPFNHDPARVICDDMDVQAYNTLEGLKKFELSSNDNSTYLKGALTGFVFDATEKKLFIRLRPDDKWGSKDPNLHTIAVPAAPVYDKIDVEGVSKSGYKGDCIGEDSNIFSIETEAPAFTVIDGFTFETPGFAAVYIRGSDVTVRNVWFRGCRSGVSGGSKYIEDIFVTDNIVVESCDYTQFPVYSDGIESIEKNYGTEQVRKNSFFWWQRKGMESTYSLPLNKDYETGGFVSKMGSNWKLRNNNLSECFDIMPWHSFATYKTLTDTKQSFEYRGIGGVEIYNNRFYRAIDNAIEFENVAYNVSMHHNEFIDNYMPISWQPMGGKRFPTNIKIYKNIIYNTVEHGKMWADIAGYSGAFFKAGAQKDQWGWWPWMADEAWNPIKNVPLMDPTPEDRGVFFFNNTIYTPYTLFLEKTSGDPNMGLRNFKFANNIFVTQPKPDKALFKADLLPGAVVQNNLGFEFNNNLYAPSVDDLWFQPGDVILNGGLAVSGPSAIGFNNLDKFNFELKEDSAARGKGIIIPSEPESSIDLGAIPYGTKYKPLEVGPRPFGDTNLDGKVDIADLTYIKQKLDLKDFEKGFDNFCDLDFDGVISDVDFKLVMKIIEAGGVQ